MRCYLLLLVTPGHHSDGTAQHSTIQHVLCQHHSGHIQSRCEGSRGKAHHSAEVHDAHCCRLLNHLPTGLVLSGGQGCFQQHPQGPSFQQGLPVRAPHALIPLGPNGVASQEGNGSGSSSTHMPSTCTLTSVLISFWQPLVQVNNSI